MKFSLKFKPKNNKKTIIFALPFSNLYQQINNLKINWQNYLIMQETKWGNRVGVFRLNDVSQAAPQISFRFLPQTYQTKINPQFTLDDYQKKRFKVITNRFINGKDQQIKKLSLSVVGKEKNLKKIVKELYSFTLDFLTYGKPIEGLYSYKQALKDKITDCGGFSTFLASLFASINIPPRLVVGFLIKNNLLERFLTFNFKFLNFNSLSMHVWLEILLPDGSWFPLDPAIEWRRNKGLTERKGGFGFIPNDRLVISYGCDFNLKINKKILKIDFLQNPLFI